MTYNQERHMELLKRSQDFKNQGKSFEKESLEEYFELLNYGADVEDHLFWQERYEVTEFMQDFLNKKIDGEEFCDQVFGCRRNAMLNRDQFLAQLVAGEVEDFRPDPRSKKLLGFSTYLFCTCDEFMEDYENDEFCTVIQNGFLKFQEVLNEE